MDRREILTQGITKEMIGIEIGPWFAPLVPKAEGYRSLALDIFDRAQLLARARIDDAIPLEGHDLIEEVDLVGGATDLAGLVESKGLTGQIDYVISSHNFEHLPNPILFLQGCQAVLKEGGFVSMAIPDRRGSFDFFRPVSTTADCLEAFHAGRDRPTAASIYELNSVTARRKDGEGVVSSWECDADGGTVYPVADVCGMHERYKALLARSDGEYVDNHCFVFTRSSFELIVRELHFLGLADLGVDWMGGPAGCEFYTRLVKGMPVPERSVFDSLRGELLQAVLDEGASNSRKATALARTIVEQQATIEALEARLASLRAAPSWRLTAPLRMLHPFFGER